jgi:hypothetical protein
VAIASDARSAAVPALAFVVDPATDARSDALTSLRRSLFCRTSAMRSFSSGLEPKSAVTVPTMLIAPPMTPSALPAPASDPSPSFDFRMSRIELTRCSAPVRRARAAG